MSQVSAEFQELTPDQLREQGLLLAREIVDQVLQPKQQHLRTVVVMEALMALYCLHARSLPPEAMGDVSMALAGVAGEFLKASSTPHAAPAGVPVH